MTNLITIQQAVNSFKELIENLKHLSLFIGETSF